MAFKVTAFAGAFFALSLASGLAQAQTSQAPHSPRASLERLKLAKAVIEAQGGAKNI